jgi:uncharacterized membrane protein
MRNSQPAIPTAPRSADQSPEQSANRRPGALVYGLMMLVSLIGLGDSLYLTIQHLTGRSVKCTVTHGCSAVLSSAYSTIAGVPVAAFGALAYFAVFSLATLALYGYAAARTGLTAVVALMTLMTLWLLYVQAFVLHAFCQYCLLSAATTLTLAILAAAAQFITRRNAT